MTGMDVGGAVWSRVGRCGGWVRWDFELDPSRAALQSPRLQLLRSLSELLGTAAITAAINPKKKELLEALRVKAWDGTYGSLCTDGCMMTAHGGVVMPVDAFMGTCTGFKQSGAFPDWVWTNKTMEELPDGRVKIGSQQSTGALQADLPAMGPFPAVSLAEAPDAIKKEGLVLPVEVGFVSFNDDATKITALDWGSGELGDTTESNCMDEWGAGVVGMALLYSRLGKPLPAP